MMRGGGGKKTFEIYDKDIKRPYKSHETVPSSDKYSTTGENLRKLLSLVPRDTIYTT
jgi:hypothetical protein